MSFRFLPHKALHACNTSSPAGMVLNDSALRELDMSPVLTVTLCLLIEARQPRRECRMIIFSSQRPKKTEYCYIASLSPSDSLAASLPDLAFNSSPLAADVLFCPWTADAFLA